MSLLGPCPWYPGSQHQDSSIAPFISHPHWSGSEGSRCGLHAHLLISCEEESGQASPTEQACAFCVAYRTPGLGLRDRIMSPDTRHSASLSRVVGSGSWRIWSCPYNLLPCRTQTGFNRVRHRGPCRHLVRRDSEGQFKGWIWSICPLSLISVGPYWNARMEQPEVSAERPGPRHVLLSWQRLCNGAGPAVLPSVGSQAPGYPPIMPDPLSSLTS